MPAYVENRGGKFRVVDASGLVRNNAGTAVDGGGHATRGQAEAQARAINANSKKSAKK